MRYWLMEHNLPVILNRSFEAIAIAYKDDFKLIYFVATENDGNYITFFIHYSSWSGFTNKTKADALARINRHRGDAKLYIIPQEKTKLWNTALVLGLGIVNYYQLGQSTMRFSKAWAELEYETDPEDVEVKNRIRNRANQIQRIRKHKYFYLKWLDNRFWKMLLKAVKED